MDAAPTAKPVSEVSAWHSLTVDEVLKRLRTSTGKGLDTSEASTRLQKYGPNRLPEGKKRGPFTRFLAQLNNILVYVLLGAGFVKLMLGLWLDAGIIFGVVLLNALLGFIQEGKAEKALDSIRNMLSAEARTTRGGETRMMLEATDTEFAPWHIVPSDDKRRARLSCIRHLLSLIPYKKVKRQKVKLPKRSKKGAYDDQATLKCRRFIPAH